MSHAVIWQPVDGTGHTPLPLPDAGVTISSAGVAPATGADAAVEEGALLLLPVDSGTGSTAVALAARGGPAALRNGVRLGAGLHFLAHEDRLEVASKTFWFSATATPEETEYDPEIHGENVFCFRTKKRPETGEPIVICPGTPQKDCGMIFRASAWEIGVSCHNCHYDPSTPPWRPPNPVRSSLLDSFLDLAREPEEGRDEH